MRFVRYLLGSALTLALAPVMAGPLWSAEPDTTRRGAYDPPVFTEERISLLEAIRTTLEYVPSIRLQEEDVRFQGGLTQEASGQFDVGLAGDLGFEYLQDELTRQVIESEAKKRKDLGEDVEELLAREEEAERRSGEYGDAFDAIENYSGGDLDPVVFQDSFDQAEWNVLAELLEKASSEERAEVEEIIRQWVVAQRDGADAEYEETRQSRQEAERLLKSLGTVPQSEETYRGHIELELSKQFRNGIVTTPFARVNVGGTNFIGKPRANDFGGKGISDAYRAVIGFRVDLPLGRGRGVDDTGAAEKAAELDESASIAAVTHTASIAVHQAILAYWRLVESEKRLDVLERSLDLNERLLEISRSLVASDEMPRAELARAQAREAEARALVQSARLALYESRLDFATTIGLEVNEPTQAPLAGDDFPVQPDTLQLSSLDPSALAQEALHSRYDYKAAVLVSQGGKVRVRAAELGLRMQTDLNLEVFAAGLEEDNYFLGGVGGAVNRWTGPGARIGLQLNWPMANNMQEGRLKQQRSLYSQQTVTARDLTRLIRSDVVLTVGSLQEQALQIREFTEAVGYYRQSVDVETQKFQQGLATLIDTNTTERRLLDAELALISSQKRYADLLATLRFTTGTLVTKHPDGGIVSEASLLTLPASRNGGN